MEVLFKQIGWRHTFAQEGKEKIVRFLEDGENPWTAEHDMAKDTSIVFSEPVFIQIVNHEK